MSKTKIHLEFGYHALTDNESEDVVERYEKGDTDSSIWGWGICERIKRYDPDAYMVDSLFSRLTPDYIGLEDYAKFVWLLTPEGAVDNRDSVRVYGGDEVFYYQDGEYIDFTAQYGTMLLNTFANYVTGGSLAVSGSLVHNRIRNIGATGVSRDNVASDPLIPPTGEPLMPIPSLSRRELLRLGRRGGIALVAWQYLQNIPLRIACEMPIDANLALETVTAPLSPVRRLTGGSHNEQWIDGRTALLIEKALHTASVTGEDTAVVMGASHANLAYHFLDSSSARVGAIKNLTDILFHSLDDKINYSDGVPMTVADKVDRIAGDLACVSVHDVYKPYSAGETEKDRSQARLQKSVEYVGRFTIPACVKIVEDMGITIDHSNLQTYA